MTRFALEFGPLPSLNKAIKEAKTTGWFKAIILSAVYLEHYGYLKLEEHMGSLKLELKSEHLESLNLPNIALLLFVVGKIGKPEYDAMLSYGKKYPAGQRSIVEFSDACTHCIGSKTRGLK